MTRAETVLLVGTWSLLLAEVVGSRLTGARLFRWKDTLLSWSLQAMTGAVSTLGKLWLLVPYSFVLDDVALHDWQGSPIEWFLAFLLYDVMGYWFHRWSHRTNLGWAIHHPHHSSEQLNLTVAMRTAPLRSLVDWPTLLPLALFGVPVDVLMFLYVVHVAGQFWIHVTWVPDLGPLGWVVNTPSHHRVHHGCQKGYQDANYGANLIVWDRMFGTYVPETEPAIYGVTRPTPGWDPLKAVTEPFAQVWRESRGWSALDRIQVWWRPPGWRPGGDPGRPVTLPDPRSDFALARWGTAAWELLVAHLLLLSIAAQAPSLAATAVIALLGPGLWAIREVGLALDDRGPTPRERATRALLTALAAPLAPWSVAPVLLLAATVSAVRAVAEPRAPDAAGPDGTSDAP